jgi:hypothetical protein
MQRLFSTVFAALLAVLTLCAASPCQAGHWTVTYSRDGASFSDDSFAEWQGVWKTEVEQIDEEGFVHGTTEAPFNAIGWFDAKAEGLIMVHVEWVPDFVGDTAPSNVTFQETSVVTAYTFGSQYDGDFSGSVSSSIVGGSLYVGGWEPAWGTGPGMDQWKILTSTSSLTVPYPVGGLWTSCAMSASATLASQSIGTVYADVAYKMVVIP